MRHDTCRDGLHQRESARLTTARVRPAVVPRISPPLGRAAVDAGPAAGFDVGAVADPIPLLSHAALTLFLAALALAGAWLLARKA